MDFYWRRLFILIVDDNQDLAVSLSMLLRFAGFDVEVVHDGLDAIRVARVRRPDVVLLDIGLPGLNGFQVAEQMRSDPNLTGTFIIAISGYDRDMFPERFQRAGFDLHLVKPVDFNQLKSLLSRLL